MKDLKNDIAVEVALNPQAITTDTTTDGNAIDLQDYESCTFTFFTGTVTDGDYTPVIEESDTGDFSGEETAVADADLIGTEANVAFADNDDDNKVGTIGYIGDKRYVRFTVVSTNTSSGAAVIGAHVIKGHPLTKPDVTNLDTTAG